MNLNTDESVSTVPIKTGSILRFNHLYGFWSLTLLSQLELFKVLVYGKLCFNLKLSVFCFISFFFLLLFFISFRFFISYVFNSRQRKLPSPRLGLEFRLPLGLGLVLGATLEAIVLEPFLPVEEKETFYMPTKC